MYLFLGINSKNILKKSCLQECAKKWVAITAGTFLCCIYFNGFIVNALWPCIYRDIFSIIGALLLIFLHIKYVKFLGDEIPKEDVAKLLDELCDKEDDDGYIPYVPFLERLCGKV